MIVYFVVICYHLTPSFVSMVVVVMMLVVVIVGDDGSDDGWR